MDKKIWYWSIRHVHHRTGEKTGVSAGVVIAETQEEAEKIIYQHINPVYACYWRTRTRQKLRKHLYPGTVFQIMPET